MKQKCFQKQFQQELSSIRSFEPGFSKISQIGYLLKCFYELHSNTQYEDSLRYSMGFEGYINNLTGIYQHLSEGKISNTTFSTETLATKIKKQYYAVYIDSKHVKNNCDLSNNIIITGGNASGKTTMLKTTSINIILSQQFGMGCFQSCVICPYTHIHSYLNIPDTSGRDSLFQLEAKRCRDIIDIIRDSENARHFAIYDELFSGTNPNEAVKTGYSFLLYLSKYKNVDFILTTHYISLCKKLENKLLQNTLLKGVSNYKMIVIEDKLTGKIKYTYVMKKGISKIQGAILVLEEMNYPKEILDEIKQMN
jgi:DNA mismatch repair ATPase MutS